MATEEEDAQFIKQKLYSNFKDAGLLDNLRAQMRYKIMEKLQKKEPLKENVNTQNFEPAANQSALNTRVLVSLFSEYLQFHNYNYTNAVFLPEAGHSNQVLTRSEVIEILRLQPILKENDKRALVYGILDQMHNLADNRGKKMSTTSQTDFEMDNLNLEQKLNKLDYEYMQKVDEDFRGSNLTLEEKFGRFKKDYDTRMKAEMQAEISRIREFEIAGIKLEEAEKCRIKMEQYREELDRIYTDKMHKLRDREKDTIEKCKQQVQMLESASYEYRQKFLKDMEIHKLRESDWDNQVKLEKENLKIQKERLENLEKDLHRQLRDAESHKEVFRKRVDEGKSLSKLELLKEMEDDRTSIIAMRSKLEAEVGRLEQYKSKSEQLEDQCKRLLEENGQMRDELKELRAIKKDMDTELQRTKDTVELLKKSHRKDEEHLKLFDKQIKSFNEETARWKAAAEDFENLAEQRKREQIESNQKFIKEIEFYQSEIEKLEKERNALRFSIRENEEKLNNMPVIPEESTVSVHEIGIQKDNSVINNASILKKSLLSNMLQSNLVGSQVSLINVDDPKRRFEELTREMHELRRKRDDEMFSLFYEPTHTKPTSSFTIKPLKSQASPHFKTEREITRPPFSDDSSYDIKLLEKNKDQLTEELRFLMQNQNTNLGQSKGEDSFNITTPKDPKDRIYGMTEKSFENYLESYTDKLVESNKPFPTIFTVDKNDSKTTKIPKKDTSPTSSKNNSKEEIESKARRTGDFGGINAAVMEKETKPTRDIVNDIFKLDSSPIKLTTQTDSSSLGQGQNFSKKNQNQIPVTNAKSSAKPKNEKSQSLAPNYTYQDQKADNFNYSTQNIKNQRPQQPKKEEKEKDISGLFFDDLEASKSSRSNKSNKSAVQQSFEEEQPKPIIFTNNKDNVKDLKSPATDVKGFNENRGKMNLDDLSENKSKTNTDDAHEDVDFEV